DWTLATDCWRGGISRSPRNTGTENAFAHFADLIDIGAKCDLLREVPIPSAVGLWALRRETEPMPVGSSDMILVVDDDAIFRDALRRQLSQQGLACVTAASYEAALRTIRQTPGLSCVVFD